MKLVIVDNRLAAAHCRLSQESSIDMFRLPPLRCDSLSSVEPNVDSSLSSLPSDSSSRSSSSSDQSESESSEELASPQEDKPVRNTKSAALYRKHQPRKVQARAATGRVQPSQGRVREQGESPLISSNNIA